MAFIEQYVVDVWANRGDSQIFGPFLTRTDANDAVPSIKQLLLAETGLDYWTELEELYSIDLTIRPLDSGDDELRSVADGPIT